MWYSLVINGASKLNYLTVKHNPGSSVIINVINI